MKQIQIKDRILDFEVVESNIAKNIRLEFKRTKSLLRLIHPKGMIITDYEQYLKKVESWIINKLDKLEHLKIKKAKEHSSKEIGEFKNRVHGLAKYYSDKTGLKFNRIFFKNQKTKLGSCSSKKNININLILINYPDYVQEYIVVHEVAHLKYMNHSIYFKQFVKDNYSKTKKALKWLKENKVETS